MRALSPLIQSSIAALSGPILHYAFDITLRTGPTVNYATGTITVSSENVAGVSTAITPIGYTGNILNVPSLSFAIGQSPDSGEIEIENVTYNYTKALISTDRPFDYAKVNVYVCFPKSDGTFERDIIFVGKFKESPADEETGKITLISDIQDRAPQTGAHYFTQKCLAELGDVRCRRTNLPPGATCSKVYDDAENGCLFWDNQHAFVGIDKLKASELPSQQEPGGGWDEPDLPPNGGYCVDPESFIWTPEAIERRIKDIKIDDFIYDDQGRMQKVIAVETVDVPMRYHIKAAGPYSEGFELICSPDHPLKFTFRDSTGLSTKDTCHSIKEMLETGNRIALTVWATNNYPQHTRHIPGFDIVEAGPGQVVKLTLDQNGSRIYCVGASKGRFFASHNVKYNYH